MQNLKKVITLEEVVQEYMDIGEEFIISAINFKYINDSHYEDFELSVEIMGQESNQSFFQEDSPIAEYTIDLDTLLVNGSSQIEKKLLFTIFDPQFLQLLKQQKTPLYWNSDDEETCQIMTFDSLGNGYLQAMIE